MQFTWPVRVYYENTDAGGVVYHADYLKFMERARTEWLRTYGIEQDQLRREQQQIFVVSRLCVEYRKPAYFNDLLEVSLELTHLGRARVALQQNIHRDEVLLCTAEVKLGCIHSESFRVQPLPAVFVQAAKTFGACHA